MRLRFLALLIGVAPGLACDAPSVAVSTPTAAPAAASSPLPALPENELERWQRQPGTVQFAVEQLGDGVLMVGSPTTCAASASLLPVFDHLSDDYGQSIQFAAVDAKPDELPHGFQMIPWTFVVSGGRIVDGYAGAFGGPNGEAVTRPRLLHLLERNQLIPLGSAPPLKRLMPSALNRDLAHANLSTLSLAGLDLEGRDLRGINLAGADLSRTNLRNADLRGALLMNASLLGAELSGAQIDDAIWYRATCSDGKRIAGSNSGC